MHICVWYDLTLRNCVLHLPAIAMASIVPLDPSLVRAAGSVAVVATRAGDFDDDDDDDEDFDLASYRIRNRIRLMHHRFHTSNFDVSNHPTSASAPTTGQVSLRTLSVGSSSESTSSNVGSSAPARGFLQRQYGFMQVRDHIHDLDGGVSDEDDRSHSSIPEILSERRHQQHLDDQDSSSSDNDIENIRLPQRSGTAS